MCQLCHIHLICPYITNKKRRRHWHKHKLKSVISIGDPFNMNKDKSYISAYRDAKVADIACVFFQGDVISFTTDRNRSVLPELHINILCCISGLCYNHWGHRHSADSRVLLTLYIRTLILHYIITSSSSSSSLHLLLSSLLSYHHCHHCHHHKKVSSTLLSALCLWPQWL